MASVTFDATQVAALSQDLVDAYYRVSAPEVITLLRAEAPIDTGWMRQQHLADPPRRTGAGTWRIRFRARVPYGVFVHEGHGWIYPVHARALRWVNKQGVVVFAKRVRPVPANPWFVRGFQRAGFGFVVRTKL